MSQTTVSLLGERVGKERSPTPPALALALTLLGEALAAMVLLVDTLKIKGSVILQVRVSARPSSPDCETMRAHDSSNDTYWPRMGCLSKRNRWL